MRQVASRLARRLLRAALVRRGVAGGVADVRARVQPVVRADGDAHEAEGGEGAREGHQGLRPSVTPRHGGASRGAGRRGGPVTWDTRWWG